MSNKISRKREGEREIERERERSLCVRERTSSLGSHIGLGGVKEVRERWKEGSGKQRGSEQSLIGALRT